MLRKLHSSFSLDKILAELTPFPQEIREGTRQEIIGFL